MTDTPQRTLQDWDSASQVIVGVLADTHIPDRVDQLHPEILDLFIQSGVQLILHAGDISGRSVLEELETIAPVVAVRGNRDLVFYNSLPMTQTINIAGHSVALVHGHGRFRDYLFNKFKMIFVGYQLDLFLPTIKQSIPETEVVIFGHTHRPVNVWYNEKQLLFNPGSSSSIVEAGQHTSIGIIKFEVGQKPQAKVIEMKRWRLKKRRWEKIQ